MTSALTWPVVLCTLAACASPASDAAERQADTAARRDSIAAVAASSMSIGQVIGLLGATHAADSALGQLGATSGTLTEVKEFGRMIMREHHALHVDAAGLATEIGVAEEPPRVPPDQPPDAMRDILARTSLGPAWDRSYVQYAIVMHQAALENSARAMAASTRPEIKAFVARSAPILQKHVDKARSLEKSLGRLQDSAAARAQRR